MIDFAPTVSKAWMAAAIGARFDYEYYMDPVRRQIVDCQCNAYLSEHFDELGLFFTESNLGRREYYEPSQALIGGIQPNMILGMLVGAEFLPADDRDADISLTPLADHDPGDLPPPDLLLAHPLIRQFDAQFVAATNGSRKGLVPIAPLFWDASGRVAVHGPLTSAQKLFGDSVFMDLATDPDRLIRILDWITEASIVLARHFAELAGRDIAEIHVGECSACMVDGKRFEQVVVPSLSRFGREIAPVRLHSCGTSDHLLEAAAKIENLGSLDLGGGTSLAMVRERWGDQLRVDIAPPVDVLVAPRPDGLLKWADRVIDQNGAGPLGIVLHVEPEYALDNVRALWEHVVSRGRTG